MDAHLLRSRLRGGLIAAALIAPMGLQAPAAAASPPQSGHDTVRIVRDEYGVPHVYADTLRGLFYGDGYATAQDRLWQEDLVRRTATGTLAALTGAGTNGANVESDLFFRSYTGGSARLQDVVQHLSGQSATALHGFVDGINAWIRDATATGRLPVEYAAAHATPQPWTAEDVIATAMLSVLQVGTTGGDELHNLDVLQGLTARLGPADGMKAFADTHWLDDPSSPTTIAGRGAARDPMPSSASASSLTSGAAAAAPRASRLMAGAHAAMARLGIDAVGHSNAIALSGRLTRSGKPLLLGGPQIGYSAPQGFVEVGLHGAGFDATGVALAGAPGVLIGAGNGHAWTVTTGGDDNQDLYAEQIDPAGHPGQYFFNGAWRPYSCRTETVAVAGGAPVSQLMCESVHGPVLSMSGTTAIAMRDATRDLTAQTLAGFFGADRAQTLAQFLQAVRGVGASLNFTYADTAGHIAYAHVGPVPVRPATDNRFLPHPGDGTDEWQGFLPLSAMPLSVDPARGWFANWNNKPRAGWANSSDGFWQWGPVHRVQVIMRQVSGIAPHTATMSTLERINRATGQITESPVADEGAVYVQALLRPMLADVEIPNDPRLAAIVDLLRHWNQQRIDANSDGRYDSPAVTVFNAWYAALVDSVFVPKLGPDFAAGGADENTTSNLVMRLLQGSSAALPLQLQYVVPGTVDTAVTNALVSALDALTAQYGTSDVHAWLTDAAMITWKPLGAVSVPQTPWMNRGTYNQILALGPGPVRGENVVAPGQSGDVRSPHATDQLTLYATWRYKPMRLYAGDVRRHATSVLVLHP